MLRRITGRWPAWTALAVVVALAAASPARGAAGDLDPSFSGDGKVSLLSAGSFVARAVSVQPDKRIVVAGFSCTRGESGNGICLNDGDSSFRVARFTPDGGLDPEFGQGGIVTTAVGTARAQAFDLLLLADGRILVGGVARDAEGRDAFALAAYTPTGALDSRFADAGVALTPVGTGFAAIADLVAQPDGAVIAVGHARDAEGRGRVAIARYGLDGRLDSSFGPFGTVLAGGAPYDYGLAGSIGPDGTIVTAGIAGAADADPASFQMGFARVRNTGAVDGTSQVAVGSSSSFANAMQGLGDGRWLAAGAATDPEGRQVMAVVRGHADGTVDTSWTGDGVALVRVGDGAIASDVSLDPAGRAVAVGQAAVAGGYHWALARFDGAGALDASFGNGGLVTTSWQRFSVARGTAGALAPDGTYVATGIGCDGGTGSQCDNGTPVLLLARYLGDPPPPPPPPPPGPGPGPAPRDTTPPSARILGVPARMRRGTLARRGLRVQVLLSEEASIVAILRRRSGRRWIALARRSLPVAGGRRVLRLRPRGRLTPRGRPLTVRLELTLSDRAGNVARLARTVRAG